MEFIVLFTLFTSFTVNAVDGAIAWNWVLGIPLGSEIYSHTVNNDSLAAFSSSMEIEKTPKSNSNLNRKHRHQHGLNYCKVDHHCGRRMFCDIHYGICRRQRKDGEHCREDKHCFKNSECVFGMCRKMIKFGLLGAKCQNNSDCGPNSCCARNHGEMICKSRLPLGHNCFVPNGGLDYSINEMCPCEDGLYCSSGHFQQKFDASLSSRLIGQMRSKSEVNAMRCTPFPVESFIKIS